MTPSLQQAILLHQQGNLAEAERFYAQAVQLEPRNFMARQFFGTLRLQQGRNADAVANFDHVIKLKPDYAEAHNNRGIALCNLQRFEDALISFDRALAIKRRAPDVLSNRGLALYYLKRSEAALASYDKALAIQSQYPDALAARGNVLADLQRFEEALASFDKVVAMSPQRAELHYGRGGILMNLSRFELALANFEQALKLKPDYADAWNNRGSVLQKLGRIDEALASFERAIALKPDMSAAHHNRGLVFRQMGRFQEAIASYDRALAIQPEYIEAWNNRGLILKELKRPAEALACFDRALAGQPASALTLNNRGAVLWDMGRIDEAVASFDAAVAADPGFAAAFYNRGSVIWARKRQLEPALRDLEKVLSLDPDYAYARGDLMHLKMYGGAWQGFEEQLALVDAGVRAGRAVAVPFVYQAISQSPADLQTCARSYAERTYPAARALCKTSRRPGKIRIGYVCGEFREHATSYLTAGLYEAHDRNRFEIVAFDNGQGDESPLRRRLEAAFDKLVTISMLEAFPAAQRIAAEDIDILVNLNGYYGGLRMDVFAHRPAPIQVNFLGFPGTLGASYIDYIVADRIVIPQAEQQYFTEKVVYLPDSYQVNDTKRNLPQMPTTRAIHGLPEAAFVFCYFNYTYKLTPATFARWMRILRQVEGSVLWLLQSSGPFADNLRREAAKHGVAGERLIFAPVLEHQDHLARLPLGDLFLDSLPYNAHTTASDALRMGLPLITCRGASFAGRVAASLLYAAGLPELVTETPEAFEALALKLAEDPVLLAGMRQKLGHNIATAPLFDTALFTRRLEGAYTTMFETCRRGEAPRSFSVEP